MQSRSRPEEPRSWGRGRKWRSGRRAKRQSKVEIAAQAAPPVARYCWSLSRPELGFRVAGGQLKLVGRDAPTLDVGQLVLFLVSALDPNAGETWHLVEPGKSAEPS